MQMKVYVVNFNTDVFKVEADVVTIKYASIDEQYDKLIELLGSDGLDVLDYNDDIAILVDDVGVVKPNNPVFELKTEDGHTLQLVGKLLFVRNVYNADSTDFGGITYEDVEYIRNDLNIKIIGMIK